MESIKTERKIARSLYTKSKNDLLELIKSDSPDNEAVETEYQYFMEKAENLFRVEERVKEQWLNLEKLDEALFMKDMDTAEAYKKDWINLKVKYEKFYKVQQKESNYEDASNSNTHVALMKKLRLPKLEMPKFDGNAKNWISFWSIFKKIHNDDSIDNDDKFAYLLQSIEPGSPAKALVGSFPPCGMNYYEAIEQLKARYARDELLIEIYVRELLSLVLQQAKGENMSVAILYDRLKTQLRALESLGVTSEKYAAMLYPLVESALPAEMLRVWERQRSRGKEADILNNLLDFVKLEVESEERISITRNTYSLQHSIPTAACLTAGSSKKPDFKTTLECIWCDKTSHNSLECYKAQKMTLKAREEKVAQKKACNVCLKIGHHVRKCKSFTKCLVCQKHHNVLLCGELKKDQINPRNNPTILESNSAENSELAMMEKHNKVTLLQTLIVTIKGTNVRAFIDTGAQRSYILKDIATKLNLPVVGTEILKHNVFGGLETNSETHTTYNIPIKSLNNDFTIEMIGLSKKKICGYIPRINVDSKLYEKLKYNNIFVSDVEKGTSEVGLLIGADYAGLIMTGNLVSIDNKITAIKTKLGWTIQGVTNEVQSSVFVSVDLTDISQLWELEVMGIEHPKEKLSKLEEEKEVLDIFERTVTINEEQRYEVALPWKIDRPRLLENKELAQKRLNSTTKKLEKLKEVENYNAVFQEWLSLGIIEKEHDVKTLGHYLPHQAVIKESSLTTRVRPVFDASARDYNGNSINSCLEKGQNFLELIPIMLMRFRKYSIGITADIKKAFLQISIAEEDRKYLRFLWYEENDRKKIVTYRHRRVVFGLTCSPFLLTATIRYHLNKYTDKYEHTAQLLAESLYVDNCVISIDSKEEAEKFIAEAKHIMSEGKFELRGWITSPIPCVGTEEEAEISVLGMKWDIKTDELYCHIEDLKSFRKTITKRELLSIVHKIFDPIGFICPATVTPKMLLQKTWNLKLTWDAELPEEICNEYEKWLQHIHLLRECRIKRRLSKVSLHKCKKSLHVFCDASSKAFATCIFIRTEMDGDVDVELVMAKARVAPVKKISIPRLELIAALMATRLYRQVQEALSLEDCETYFWSDSSVAITWITSDGDWSTFVKNRVREIRENTNREDWQHISGSQNPADLPSRGCHAKKLLEERWWEGPAWLRLECTEWPIVSDFERDEAIINSERKPIVCLETISEDFSLQFNNLSNYMKILRTMAWIKRFIRNCRTETRDKDNLGEKEIEDAEIHLFKLIQKADPCESTCRKGALEIIEDGEGLKRVKTRLTLGDYNEDFKFPIILPGKHKIVEKLIYFKHRKKLHAGLNILASELRNNLWIVGAKRAIRRVISTCIICKRFTAKKYETPDPPLPRNRIKESATFQVTGIDAAGPLFLKTGEKCYIILFTCAVYRAVHLELVMSMSTESFIMALRRFIARRGRCQTIYTDNGSNFKGAETQFNNLNWDQIKEVERIQWIFNPPAAPWWGGWWERLIQSIKQLLRRNLGKSTLSYIELQTLLCDIESLINARPLTYITEGDPWQPLTPAMFLNTLPSAEVPDLDAVDAANLNVRLKYLQKLRQDLRNRFTKEYLSLLICKNKQSTGRVQIGDIVLVETEAKRMHWPLGIVTAIFTGKDGVCRVAVVKTADGERTRPVQRLYQLEITCEGVRPPAAVTEAIRKTTSGRAVRAPRRLDL